MSDESEQPGVPVTVSRPSSDSDEESYVSSSAPVQRPDYNLVVPITGTLLDTYTGINVRQFLRTAVALAAENDGRVLLLGVETVADEAALETVKQHVQGNESTDSGTDSLLETIEERRVQLDQMVAVAEELSPGVPVSAVVRTVVDSTEGILSVLGSGSDTAVLLLRGTGLDQGWLLNRSTVDTVLADAECDVFVENMGAKKGDSALYVPDIEDHTVAPLAESEAEPIESILLPVGMGPHSALAAEATRAVARSTDAPVTVLHVISSDASAETRADGKDLLKFADYVLGSEVTTETELREAPDVTDAIADEAKSHNFVSIGAPEQKSGLEQLFFQPVEQTLSEMTATTILMSRDSNRTMRSLYYRWKRGIESVENSTESETG